ncbi:hypothetical protein R6Q59_018043 [Mikania micrantha]|uniref:Uncharacterized protein n=1 Tax=Mikania micrantha TaxID=192012 RepID=A0A5N6M1S0_9ASTR|nr:hypothetical protein E3N88_35725 [Mikania micrantha]KAD3067955.1 hypothetical protein E3N88_35835 [Mikania micrantha]
MDDDARKFSLKDKIKQFFCLACCFTANRRETLRSDSSSSAGDATKRPLFFVGASSKWIKSRASVDLPEIKHKCCNLISRIGGNQYHRRRRSSADFSYDPLSYALNFEEDACGSLEDDDDAVKSFVSRLPPSPPPSSVAPADHQSLVSITGV